MQRTEKKGRGEEMDRGRGEGTETGIQGQAYQCCVKVLVSGGREKKGGRQEKKLAVGCVFFWSVGGQTDVSVKECVYCGGGEVWVGRRVVREGGQGRELVF